MKKRFIVTVLAGLMTIVSTPLNYLPSLFSSPGIGTELRLSVPQSYPLLEALWSRELQQARMLF